MRQLYKLKNLIEKKIFLNSSFFIILKQLVAFAKLKHQILCYSPEVKQPKDFDDNTLFWINQDFCIV
jgi:hypothetical protein